MAQRFYTDPNLLGVGPPVIGKNSEAFAYADPVNIDSNGWLVVAPAGERILGWCLETVTMAATNQTVAKVKPKYVPALGVLMQITADQTCTQTDVGAYADITGTTGAINVNLAAGASGSLFVWQFDPAGDGTTTEVVVSVAEPQDLAYAQA